MQGPKRTCKKCGHDCHCYAPDCKECINDVCYKCDCVPTPDMPTDATTWKWSK
jgi:hypothetical protein